VNKIRLSSDEIMFMNMFEGMTHAKVEDCVQGEDVMGFVVQKGDVGLAVGKKGANIEKVRRSVGKNVWVVEYSNDPEEFIRNIFHPVEIKKINISDSEQGKVASLEVRRSDRSKVIGLEGMRIRFAKKMVKRHCNIDDITIKTTGQ